MTYRPIIPFLFFLFPLSIHVAAFQDNGTYDSLMNVVSRLKYDHTDSALHYIEQLEEMFSGDRETSKLADVLYQKGSIFYIAGDYVMAQASFDDSYVIAEKYNDQSALARVLNGRGLIFLGQQKYFEALDLWKQALQVFQDKNDLGMQANLRFNIGLGYSQVNQFDEAILNLNIAREILQKVENPTLLDMVINRLGKVYFDLGDYEKADIHYNELKGREASLSIWEKTFLYAGLAELEFERENFSLATSYSEKSAEFATSMKALWDLERALGIWSNSLEASGDFTNALKVARRNKIIRDSLYNIEKEQEINFLQLQVAQSKNEQLEQEKQLISQKSKLSSWLNWVLLVFVLFLVGISLIYRRNLKMRESFNTRLEKLNNELKESRDTIASQNESLNQINEAKNKLFSIISHDLRSPIGNLKSFIQFDKKGVFAKEEKFQVLELLEGQLEKTDILLENLLQWARTQLEGFDPRPELFEVKPEVLEILHQFEYQIKFKNIDVHLDENDGVSHQVFVDKSSLRIILQNIIGNAIKFSPEFGRISIDFTNNSDHLMIHVKDSGDGLDPEQRAKIENDFTMIKSKEGTMKEKGTGLGLLLVKQLLVYNGGFLRVKSELGKGTEMIIHLKNKETEIFSE